MRWLSWFRRDREPAGDEAPLDLERLVAEAIRDPQTRRRAIARLRRERRALVRRQRAVAKQFERLTPVRVRNMARSGPAIGSLQLSQAMDHTSSLSQDADRAKQEAEVVQQIRMVDTALARLNAGR